MATADAYTILVRVPSATASRTLGIFSTSLYAGQFSSYKGVIIITIIMMFFVVEYIVLLMYGGICIV